MFLIQTTCVHTHILIQPNVHTYIQVAKAFIHTVSPPSTNNSSPFIGLNDSTSPTWRHFHIYPFHHAYVLPSMDIRDNFRSFEYSWDELQLASRMPYMYTSLSVSRRPDVVVRASTCNLYAAIYTTTFIYIYMHHTLYIARI